MSATTDEALARRQWPRSEGADGAVLARLGAPTGSALLPLTEGLMASVVPPTVPDFDRKVVSILGLPFDAIDLRQAVQKIRHAAFTGRRCFVSTGNINFAMSARSDPWFRETVLRSDLNLVDGMPLVWIARLLKLPVTERVAGADLFEALQAHTGTPIKVYLFGGPTGAAEQACERINRRGGGIRCVGHDAAGFGSIESMSGKELIDRINASGAQFVMASLGAKKGQAWLEHNASRLTAPVLCHLGAVINFAAGTVRRAPRRMRWLGLEWLWRIKEEPGLWRRYWNDGSGVLTALIHRVIPDWFSARLAPRRRAAGCGSLEMDRTPNAVLLRLDGDWRDDECLPLRRALATCAAERADSVSIDLSRVGAVGDTFISLCLLAQGYFRRPAQFRIFGASPAVSATFRRKMAEHLLAETASR